MKFIRVGGKAINLDQVTDVAFEDDSVIVFFAGSFDNIPGGPPMTRTLRLQGAAGAALRLWLERHSEDVMPNQPPRTPVARKPAVTSTLYPPAGMDD